jgi:hypothetical protein
MSRRLSFILAARDRWPCVVYTSCLTGATWNHARDVWLGGWLPYRFAPLAMNAYWTSLTALDLLAAGMLWLSPRCGLVLTLAIIASDVAVNSYAVYGLGYDDWHAYGALQSQTLFLEFVIGSLPFAWPSKQSPIISPASASTPGPADDASR